jgi:hypothetical protein
MNLPSFAGRQSHLLAGGMGDCRVEKIKSVSSLIWSAIKKA